MSIYYCTRATVLTEGLFLLADIWGINPHLYTVRIYPTGVSAPR